MAEMVSINVDNTQKMLLKRNMGPNGKAGLFLASQVRRMSDPYAPFSDGTLKNAAFVNSHGQVVQIVYPVIYSRYHWHGKVMVGRAPKRVTNKDMVYRNGSKRGPHWVTRMWADRGDEIVRAVAGYTGGRKG